MPPASWRLPTTRRAYWIGMRRCARSKYTITPTTATMNANSRITPIGASWSVRTMSQTFESADGMLVTMPAKMMSEMPLPMPRSLICSPSHMMNDVPAVSVMMVLKRKPQPGSSTVFAPSAVLSAVASCPGDREDDRAVASSA
jgi:hypothetical protein